MNAPLRAPSHPLQRRAQRGLAALVVVMVLFFVVSLVAAYTNRNLIFEQRTSANYYRGTQIFSVAQAGVDWATAMINGGRMLDNCTLSSSAGDASFRERYLSIDPTTGYITPVPQAGGGRRSAACVYNGSGWNCSCPTDADPAPTVPTGAGPFPAYRVRFATVSNTTLPNSVIRLEVVGCPRLDLTAGGCLDFDNSTGDEGRQFISVVLGLHSGMKTTPAAALTARGNITVSGSMQAHNADIPASGVKPSGGIAVQAGGSISGLTVTGAPGMPAAAATVESDPSLHGLTGQGTLLPTASDRMFANMFGLPRQEYSRQPALYKITPCPCNASTLRAAIQMNPGRPIWVDGNLSLDSAGDIGSATAPVAVVVDGQVTASASINYYGMLYARANPTWNYTGNLTFNGAVVAENTLSGSGSTNFIYDPALLQRLRVTTGSFVPVAASWKDWVMP